MTAPVFECRDVAAGHRTEGGGSKTVLESVNFVVDEAEAVAIVGASGSGKSTLVRLLNRFDDPVRGTVSFRGRPIQDYDPLEIRRKVALVLQTPVMFDGTVRDNLSMGPAGVTPPTEAAMRELLEEVGLATSLLDHSAEQLSGGEKQRIAIARALAGEPDAIVLDEPTSALDPKTAALVAKILNDLRSSRQLTLVFITHARELLALVAGRRFLVHDGRVDVDVSPERIEKFLEAGE